MMSETLAVINDIKNPPNKIIIPCSSIEDGEEIIEKIKKQKARPAKSSFSFQKSSKKL